MLNADHTRLTYQDLCEQPVSADIYRGGANGLELAEHLGPEEVLTTPMLPGSSLSLKELVE